MSNLVVNTDAKNSSKLSLSELRQSQVYDKVGLLPKLSGTLTQTYGANVWDIFLSTISLQPTEAQQKVLELFKETFVSIEEAIDPNRQEFTISKGTDDEICISRKASTGGRVVIIIHEEGQIALSFIPTPENNTYGEELSFLDNTVDIEGLSYQFFQY